MMSRYVVQDEGKKISIFREQDMKNESNGRKGRWMETLDRSVVT